MNDSADTMTIDDFKGSVENILAPKKNTSEKAMPEPGTVKTIGRDIVMRVPVTVQVVLGKVRLPVSELMQLTKGAVLALDRKLGEPVDLVVNGRLVARGEIIVVEDSSKRFGISLTEIVENPDVE